MTIFRTTPIWVLLAIGLSVTACSKSEQKDGDAKANDSEVVRPPTDPYPSSYLPYPSQPTLITGATLLTATGERIENGAILIRDGKIEAIGATADIPEDESVIKIEATEKYVTPGIIDIHSHLGVYPSPGTQSTADGNEATSPNTAQVWAEHSVWPHDPGFTRALAGGVTSLQILPGSANLIGGRSAILKNIPARIVQDMKFPGAPYGMKMACGENPKRVYEDSGPSTRMGNFAGYRAAWIEATDYKKKWDDYWSDAADEDSEESDPPTRDLKLETLAAALRGEININMHCYRGDEMAQVLDMAKEFGYTVTAFHHAVEAFKVADILAENSVCAAVWADWWGFKLEAYDSVRENAALIHRQDGGCAIIHSDSAVGIQRLNQEAAKAMADGNRMGFEIAEEHAIAWITANPAKAMGILDQTGTLEVGKMADIVIWDKTPFSVYAHAEMVFIDGALLYDRNNPKLHPYTDFEIDKAVGR